jgi:hypothetical protein
MARLGVFTIGLGIVKAGQQCLKRTHFVSFVTKRTGGTGQCPCGSNLGQWPPGCFGCQSWIYSGKKQSLGGIGSNKPVGTSAGALQHLLIER